MELNTGAGSLSMDQEYYITREDVENFKQDITGCGVNDGFYILKVDDNTQTINSISNGFQTDASIMQPMQTNNIIEINVTNINDSAMVKTLTNSHTKTSQLPKKTETYDERFPFKCKLCSACFTQKKLLTSHSIYSHKNNKPVNSNVIFCNICSYLTIEQKYMDQHMKQHEAKSVSFANRNAGVPKDEPVPQYFCNKCTFSCKLEDTFKKHRELHNSLELFQLKKQKTLRNNAPTNPEISPYSHYKPQTLMVKQEVIQPTPELDMQPSSSNTSDHQELVINDMQMITELPVEVFEPTHFFKCKECDFTSSDLTQLKDHQKDCHGCFRCLQCDVVFDSNAHLKQHQQIHVHNFDCNLCGQEFALLKDLKAHHKVHANRNKYFYCSICGFMSFNEKEIRNHFPCLSENVCQKCKMKFKHPLSLKKHIEENHGTFQCDHCGHTVVDKKKDFINHVKQHEEEKGNSVIKESYMYQCFECNKGFKVRNRLSEHLKTHGIFTCHICDSSFFSTRDLKLHAFTHEEKLTTYLCEQCGLECATKYDLSNHVVTHNIAQNNYEV